MKNIVILSLCLLIFGSCKKELDGIVKFPREIRITNTECLQTWQRLNFESIDYGTNIDMFEVKGWFGVIERDIATNPVKFDYSSGGDGFGFYIDSKDLGDSNFIYLRLTGYTNKGAIGVSSIYKFKKTVANDCVKWIAF